jgi:hypothetical protein
MGKEGKRAILPFPFLSSMRSYFLLMINSLEVPVCHPSPFLTLSPFASLRINSTKGHPKRSEGSQDKLREESEML